MHVSVYQQYESALAHQAEGNLPEAERLYRTILSREPRHSGATHHLGIIAMVTGYLEPAEQLIRQSIALEPAAAPYYNTLAEVLRRAGKDDEAVAALQQAISLDASSPHYYSNIAVILSNARRHDEALPWLLKSVELAPDFAMAHFLLGQLQLELGQSSEATTSLRRSLEIDPDNDTARFLLAAATGETPLHPPPGFVEQVFDSHAAHFEQHVVETLGYRVPELLRAAVDRVRPDDKLDILDLGCGTGLAGKHFRDLAKSLAGVDISKRMIEVARQTGTYDALTCEQLVPAIRSQKGAIDLVVAADVFIYVGELSDVFDSSKHALRQSGLFAFSVELHAGDGFVLRPSRRYAHSKSYIESLASSNGFEIIAQDAATLRRERNDNVAGVIYVLRVIS